MSEHLFYPPIDLEALADAITPLIAERLEGRSNHQAAKAEHHQPETRQDNAPDDPWADDTPAEPARPARGSGGRQKPAQSRSKTVTDDRGKTWVFGKSGAPDCECGEPAAEVSAVKNGKSWKAWACAKGYGDTWRDKCGTFDFH